MRSGGDEVGKSRTATQRLLQDNETRLDWLGRPPCAGRRIFTDFVGHMTRDQPKPFRKSYPPLARGHRATGPLAVLWLTAFSEELKEKDWKIPEAAFSPMCWDGGASADRRSHRSQRAPSDPSSHCQDAGIQELGSTIEHRRR